MHTLINQILKQSVFGGNPAPFTYGYAVAFPDCKRFDGALPPAMHKDLILDADKCQNIRPSLAKVFDRFSHRTLAKLTTVEIDGIHAALFPDYAILPVIWRKVEDQEVRLQRLTDEQQKLLDFIQGHTHAAIRGVAGSGKTILALAKAQEMASNGVTTLFLCYNRLLKEWIEQAVADQFGGKLKISTYHGLISHLCHKARVPYRPQDPDNTNNKNFWRNEAPMALVDAASIIGDDEKFDAVIVDEGQDFFDAWWTSLEAIFREPNNKACYYVFFDPKQNIFGIPPDHPAVYISWDDVQDLVHRLNEVEGEDIYRMPTEAEWEYACRAGTTTEYSFGNRASLLGDYGWYQANTWSDGEPYAHPVGALLPNPWGLYDMHGNIWEWVEDWLGGYPEGAQTDPVGPATGVYRVVRSGIFMAGPMGHRSAFRYGGAQDFPDGGVGVRLVRLKP